jgi:hypothetical protein
MAGRAQKFAEQARVLAQQTAAGRKPDLGIREPNGRLSRSAKKLLGSDSVNEIYRVRAAALSGAGDRRWGTQLGRLFLEGKITGEQYGAGMGWDRVITRWRAIHCGPQFNPKSGLAVLFRVSGGGASIGDIVADPVEIETTELVDDVIGSFDRGISDPTLVAVRECVELDQMPVGFGGKLLLDDGLNHLADLWRIEG